MFTDMVDSTSIQAALGDHRWMKLLDAHDRTLRKVFADRSGDGADVTIAARVADAAGAGEVLCTTPVPPQLPSFQVSESRTITVKGRDDPITV